MKTSMLIVTTMLGAAAQGAPLHYPKAPTAAVVDDYFGIEVADPYRPLEDDRSAETAAWVKAENAVTRAWLDSLPGREAIRERLQGLYDYRRVGLPSRGNDGRIYVSENDGLQPQSIIYVMDEPGGEKRVFLDPNKLSADGTVALTGLFHSPDGSLTAYTIARNGSDWTEIYVMETATGKLLDDHIMWSKFTPVVWDGNDKFYYAAYPAPKEGDELKGANAGQSVYRHRLGTPQSDDAVVYADAANPLYFHRPRKPEGSPVLFVSVSGQGLGNGLLMRALDAPDDASFTTIIPDQEKDYEVVDVDGRTVYILTNDGAPRYRLMAMDIDNPARENWREVVPEQKGVLTGAELTPHGLLTRYERDASDHLELRSTKDGSLVREVRLPGIGTVSYSVSKHAPDELFMLYTSFLSPAEVYRNDLAANTSELFYRPELKGFNPDDYVTEQVWVTSKDGTRVPMFLTYKKGIEKNATNAVYLYGYGGFNVSLKPGFSPQRLLWLENGGIYAQATLRGGGEYGEEWHVAGTKQQKVNVFDDFIACAEWLIDEGYTMPSRLTIEGGSNGGTLVGATMNMRPELFAVAIPRVGVMDMMRYHLFTIGWNWASDYGRSDDTPEMARYLLGYSPMHNIKNDGTPYPAVLVTTADHDDRVVPAHSFKYAATLQASNTGDKPKLIRIDSNAGHGAGKSVAKTIDEYTDIYSFIFANIEK